ncbi:hypothetical protein ACFL2G_01855 [Candidatus Omnitrophota bacterium]
MREVNAKEVNVDYDMLFRHVEGLKKVLLVGVGRAGTDFFQSLLDGHPEILQVTGPWFFHVWWKLAECKDRLPDLINEFIWCTSVFPIHIAKFKSYYNKLERWDQLGEGKNESFEVDIEVFRNHMLNILADKELNSVNFFLAVNLAYGLAIGMDINRTKILFYHIHHREKLKDFKEDFSDFEVICSIRDLRNALVSGLEHWKAYRVSVYKSRFLYTLLKGLIEESELILPYAKNFKALKLEDLHLYSREVMEEFCGMYGLELADSMFQSTHRGKKWWGDALSGKYLDGFNKNIEKINWRDKLFSYDNFLIEFIVGDRLKHYGYRVENRISRLYLIPALFLTIVPMKYEIRLLIHDLKNSRWIGDGSSLLPHGRFYYICRSLFFYLLRVRMYFGRIRKRLKGLFLADFFLQEKYGHKDKNLKRDL